jgi:molybdate transport system substrate-binding protein
MVKRISLLFAGLLAACGATSSARAQDDRPPLVFAAASLKDALDTVVARYAEDTGRVITLSYAGSPALAKQIEQGAPADIFFSADLEWMDYLQELDLVAPDSRVTLLGNEIVLVAPADSEVALTIAPGFPLAEALGDGKLAMAATASVPAGKYGKAALEWLGVWESVAENVAETENARAALAFVARGEAALGIVYATDANAEPGVRVVGALPEESHPPILYPAALTVTASPAAGEFLDFLVSDDARPFFEAEGFRVVAPAS